MKSGGHAFNLGQSSTPGVQISMSRFSDVVFNPEEGTVTIGVGLTWDEVYERLDPLGVMVVGGRIEGVGKFSRLSSSSATTSMVFSRGGRF